MAQRDGFPKLPGEFRPVFLGVAFVLAFNLLFFSAVRGSAVLPMGNDMVSRIIGMVVFIGLAVLSRRGFSAVSSKPAVWLSAVFSSGGVALSLLSGVVAVVDPGVATVVCILGLVLAQGGYCVVFLAWIELLSRMSMDYALLYYIVGRILSALLRDTLAFFDPAVLQAASCAMPLLAAALLARGASALPGLPYAQGEPVSSRWGVPWRPVVLFAVFSLVSHISIRVCDSSLAPTMLGSVAGSVFVFAVVATRFKTFSLVNMQKIALPILLASLLCAMLGPGCAAAGAFLAWMANDIFLAFVYALLFDMSYRNGINALWVFGLTQASISGGIFAAYTLGDLTVAAGMGGPSLAACIVLVTLVFLFCLTERDAESAWGVQALEPSGEGGACLPGPGGETRLFEAERLQDLCSAAARRYDLTRREEEILLLRLQGATHHDLEEGLVISSNTVKSHIRHIYRKLGATDLEEARSIVEGIGGA